MERFPEDSPPVREEFKELVRPLVAKRLAALVEQLWEDEGLWKEIHDRFEQGSLRGNYPTLLEGLPENPDIRITS
jgi:hypothetical protein